MTFDDIPAGTGLFLDANPLIYHFSQHPLWGPSCTRLLERVELRQLQGYTSAHVLSEVTHRLMTLEAMAREGWPAAGLAARLRKHRSVIAQLTLFRPAVDQIPRMNIQVLPLTESLVLAAGPLCQRYELLTNDALIVAVMQQHGLTNLASLDEDFDRVPGLTRYAPA